MVSSENNAVGSAVFNFRYQHGVDEKRRAQVPKPWRPAPADLKTEFTLILWNKGSHGPCLRVLPRAQYDKLLAQIEAMSPSDPLKATRKRMIGSWSTQVTFDTTGRICIPEELANEAKIFPGDEVKFVGLINLFEIWNLERFNAVDADEKKQAADVYRDLE